MQFAQRQRHFGARSRPLLTAVAVGLLLGFAGPFGSYPAYPTATRYAFWLGLTLAGLIAALAADAVMPRTTFRSGVVRIATVSLVSALPMTFVVAWTMSLVQQGRVFMPWQLPPLFAAVSVVQLLIVAATAVTAPGAAEGEPTDAARMPPQQAADTTTASFPAALLGRLPPGIGSEILALETEDHYLRVHTAGGSALILMRMVDAVALIDPRLGSQVHRRWWVADAAVAGMRTDDQKLNLSLTNNRLVPVGRTFSAATRKRFADARIGKPGGQS